MSTGVPVTVWAPIFGGEMGNGGGFLLTTLAGVFLITKVTSNNLITQTSTYTAKPTSVWISNDAI